MVTATNILYSASAVRRMLKIAYEIKVVIREFCKVIWVWVKGKRPTFISKTAFKNHFVQWRQQQATSIEITQCNHDHLAFVAFNPKKGTSYMVQTLSNEMLCGCEDYMNQIEFFGRGCCKHGYATLNHLGFSTLEEYLKVRQPVAA